TAINGTAVTTTLDQRYKDIVALGANTTLAGKNINFDLALDSDASGARDLTATSKDGVVGFGGAVGAVHPLRNLVVDDNGTASPAVGKTSIAGGAVTTSGTQLYKAPLELGANAALSGTTFTFNKSINSAAATPFDLILTSTTAGVNTTFTGAV